MTNLAPLFLLFFHVFFTFFLLIFWSYVLLFLLLCRKEFVFSSFSGHGVKGPMQDEFTISTFCFSSERRTVAGVRFFCGGRGRER